MAMVLKVGVSALSAGLDVLERAGGFALAGLWRAWVWFRDKDWGAPIPELLGVPALAVQLSYIALGAFTMAVVSAGMYISMTQL